MAAFDFSQSFQGINGALLNLGKRMQEQSDSEALLKAFDQSQGVTGQPRFTQPTASTSAPMPLTGSGDYFSRTRSAESSGNDAARNPASTATGRYQFLEGTWADLMKSRPDLGLTLDGRNDPQQQDKAMRAFTSQNADVLRSKSIDPTDRNLYMAHFLGGGAAPNFINAVQQDPSVPATSLVRPAVVAANRSVFLNQDGTPRTAGEVYARMTNRFGDGSTAVAALGGGGAQPVQVAQANGQPQADLPAQGAAEAQGFLIPGGQPATRENINGATIRALLANPGTRDIGKALWTQAMTGRQFGFQVVGDQLYRTNPATGAVEAVGVSKPPTPVSLSEGQILVDPRTGAIIARGQDKATKPVSVAEGGTLVNPDNGSVVYQAPAGNKSQQEIAAREKVADQQGLQGDDRKFFVLNGRLPTAAEKTTEGQANAALYADRMREANRILSDPAISEASNSARQRLFSNVPLAGNYLVSPEYQMADQAQRDFINAVLRRESGAAIAPSEFDNARRQYFPQPGDSPAVLAQKAQNRETAIVGITRAAGPVYAKQQASQNAPASTTAPTREGEDKRTKTSLPVRIQPGMTPEMIKKRFAPGTRLILPDGSEGVVK